MQTLGEIIAALRQEIGIALGDNQPAPSGVQLKAERVILNLNFRVEPRTEGVEFRFHTGEPQSGAVFNTLSIEFKCNGVEGLQLTETSAIKPQETRELEGSAEEAVIVQLSRVFGAPGFDSSARATVLREALEHLSEPQVKSVIDALADPSFEASDDVKRSISLLQRVCHAGPAGSVGGKQILTQVFREYLPSAVLKLTARVWKTQEDWLG